jgi:osmoprotectant transport system ATP-binding protein
LLGPSGCGKTTLLKTVNRLLEPTSGRVIVEGTDVASVDPVALRRRIGYAIQQVGLFPHMTVGENVAVVPKLLGWTPDRIAARVDELLDLIHLPPDEYRSRLPRELSGGQQQRVGLARALAGDPSILLMDEPFGAVDAIERAHLQDEIVSLQRRLRKTILFVTHDVDEALRLADAIVVMRAGRIEQAGTALDVLARPATGFVADLVDAHDVLRLLSVVSVATAMSRSAQDRTASSADGASIRADATLRDALSRLAASGARSLAVSGDDGSVAGSIAVDDILGAVRRIAGEPGRR